MSAWPSLDRADDERLARSLAVADTGALLQVMDRYAARLYDYCHALLRDQESAADALHDALVAGYANITVLREPDRLRGWLYALARTACLSRLRDPRRPAERHEAPEVEEVFLDGEERAQQLEARHLIHSALSGLRGREREALDLMLRHGLDAVEIAGVLGLDAQEATDLTGEARARLDDHLSAAFVARTGRGGCASVAAIAGDGEWPLPPATTRRLVRHIGACPVCSQRRERRFSSARLLQILPVAQMPTDVRGRVMSTASEPSRADELAAVAAEAEPFDTWGWPVVAEPPPPAAPEPATGTGARPPRHLWAAVAVAVLIVLVVTGGFFLMPDATKERTNAQSRPDGPSATPLDPSDPASPSTSPTASESPSPSPTPTPTPTPTTRTPEPEATPTPTVRTPRPRPPAPTPTRTTPRRGRLLVTSCAMGETSSCSGSVRALDGPVSWSVAGASEGLSAEGGGSLAAGESASYKVSLTGACTSPGGSGQVNFSPSGSAPVSWSCPAKDE